ncbi:MAG: ribonuclease Y [Thermomicrobiales bacterium]|nr:ribonuclease Y [Thermomicrobiales bacterium]MCO5225207.1 ribonuclease Y [Thermomicrobiales bacterium]MCO5227028.1 ribonuclease Y [Thermomicrobiales bacterium]
MGDLITVILVAVLVAGITFFVTYFMLEQRADSKMKKAQVEADRVIEEAESQQRAMKLAAQDEAIRLRAELDRELTQRRIEIERIEGRIEKKEESIDEKSRKLEQRDQAIRKGEQKLQSDHDTWETEKVRKDQQLEEHRQSVLRDIEAQRVAQMQEVEQSRQRYHEELERVAGLTAQEARDQLIADIEADARHMAQRHVHEIEQEAKEEADKRARKILATTIQRIASDYVSESTVSVVPLPNDEMKGRIIGREGRNIRALETATGVDLIVDDTPEAVTVSGFDPVRREVARRSLQKLLQDGRIHPARIEEVVAKTQAELDEIMREEGERVAYDANVPGLHPDLIKLLGRLKFRTSYGQNVLAHSLETSLISANLASELGADVNVAKTAGLLHDIGKAVDHEVEGPHALIGADIARRLGRSSKIVHAIAAHHNEEEPQTIEAFIVQTADAISGARPGARREMVETYIKRLEALEGVANSFEGVEKSFAIQAGREVRILVQPNAVNDAGATRLAQDVVKKIEETLEYPGQIKVTVIRETRAVDYAR